MVWKLKSCVGALGWVIFACARSLFVHKRADAAPEHNVNCGPIDCLVTAQRAVCGSGGALSAGQSESPPYKVWSPFVINGPGLQLCVRVVAALWLSRQSPLLQVLTANIGTLLELYGVEKGLEHYRSTPNINFDHFLYYLIKEVNKKCFRWQLKENQNYMAKKEIKIK